MGEIYFDNEECTAAISETTGIQDEINEITCKAYSLALPEDADIAGQIKNVREGIADLYSEASSLNDAIIRALLELQQSGEIEVEIDISIINEYSTIDIDINSIDFVEATKTEEGIQSVASSLLFAKNKGEMFNFIYKNKDNKNMSKEDQAKYEVFMYYFANYDPENFDKYNKNNKFNIPEERK